VITEKRKHALKKGPETEKKVSCTLYQFSYFSLVFRGMLLKFPPLLLLQLAPEQKTNITSTCNDKLQVAKL